MIKIIFGIWGEDKTGKTTLGLTFPKPLAIFEFDVGGYDRAKWRFSKEVSEGLIIYKVYPMPIQAKLAPTFQITERLVGFKELWRSFLQAYYEALTNPEIATLMIDTFTLNWEVGRHGFLQEKQEAQFDASGNLFPKERLRERLLPIEYAEPNSRMKAIPHAAKSQNKHLVLTHHAKDEYKPMPTERGIEDMRTGKKERAGWAPLGDVVDVMVETYLDKKPALKQGNVVIQPADEKTVPYCKVCLSGLALELVGLEFREPSYDKIMEQINRIRGEV